ncbi:hypothetical protein CK489_28440 [Bradyrhizobium sp. UFLA03-84]|uniref:response regulator transcription factor n=1 Tax=Bradyrhizobium sp. UFLA03-84 TaxID=418599 RepID=UPI000BAE2D47|nr:response regulator transcription factor [Bradyrhizobium sp. UFLA03-84]PAY06781.1 hypothetical protein CK489_28440 [Bradyrhizobium sp. UFLA03-84]
MSSAAIVPTFILQIDGLFREGLRLILSRTRFFPHGWGAELDELDAVPNDETSLFIVGVAQRHEVVFKRIRAQYPLSFIVAVGDERAPDCLATALESGVNAALFNSVAPHVLLNCLNSVIDEHLIVVDSRLWPLAAVRSQTVATLSPESSQDYAVGEDCALPSLSLLSAREVAILKRIVLGDTNKHVARFFGIAEPTVKAHVKAIFRKIGATNRTQAAIWAVNNKLLDNNHDLQPEPYPPCRQTADDNRRSLGLNALQPAMNGMTTAARAKVV